MARNLEQTLKDLKELEVATADLDTRFQQLYRQYFDQLSQGVGRQLVLAAYHICTEIYPEAFLALSVGQRERLQRQLRQIAAQGRSHLASLARMDGVSATFRLLLQASVPEFALSAGEPPSLLTPGSPSPAAPASQGSQGAEKELSQDLGQGDQGRPEQSEPTPGRNPEASSEKGSGGEIVLATSETIGTADVDRSEQNSAAVQFPEDPAVPDSDNLDGEDRDSGSPTPSDGSDLNGVALPPWQDLLTGNALPAEAIAALSDALSSNHATPPSPLSLGRRHMVLERQVRAILHSLSILANRALRQAKVLPDLPEEVLAAAAAADREEGSTTKQPNLISVLVSVGADTPDGSDENSSEEAKGDRPSRTERPSPSPIPAMGQPGPSQNPEIDSRRETDEEDSQEEAEYRPDITPLVAISLRLGDIEFADPQLTLRRAKLREALTRLRSLSRRYRKLQREKAQAEAAAAWRATWFEDD